MCYPRFIILISFFLLSLILPPQVHAQTGLTISPPLIDLILKPKTKLTQNLTLTNLGQSQNYQITIHQLIAIGSNGESTIDPTPIPTDSLPIILKLNSTTIDNNSIITLPQGKSTHTLTINTHSNSDQATDHYLALVFSPISQTNLSALPMISLPLFFTITASDHIPFDLALKDFSPPKIADSFLSLHLNPQIVNLTPHMIRPYGELKLSSHSLNITYALEPNLLLGQSSRQLRFITQKDQPTTQFTLQPSLLRFGPHTFTLTIQTPAGKTLLTESRVTWFIPIRLMLIILISLLLSVAFWWHRKKHLSSC